MALPLGLKPGTKVRVTYSAISISGKYPKTGEVVRVSKQYGDNGYFMEEYGNLYYLPLSWAELVSGGKLSGFGKFSKRVADVYKV